MKEMLILKEIAPEVYRHLVGLIKALVKILSERR